MVHIKHKRGDTFAPRCTYTVNGVAQSIVGVQVSSHLRTISGSLICEFAVVDRADVLGQYTLRSPVAGAEALWPVDVLYWDIQYIDGNGFVRSTETITVEILQDETR